MSVAGNPVREGFVQGLARPGGNVTGLTFLADGRIEPKQLQLLKDAIPGLIRVGTLANRSSDRTVAGGINAAADALGLRVQTFEVSGSEEIRMSSGPWSAPV